MPYTRLASVCCFAHNHVCVLVRAHSLGLTPCCCFVPAPSHFACPLCLSYTLDLSAAAILCFCFDPLACPPLPVAIGSVTITRHGCMNFAT